MTTAGPSHDAEIRAKITHEVERLKREFKTLYGIDAKRVSFGRLTDQLYGAYLFEVGERCADLFVERNDGHNSFMQVGVWID